jgi:hypothetical protein
LGCTEDAEVAVGLKIWNKQTFTQTVISYDLNWWWYAEEQSYMGGGGPLLRGEVPTVWPTVPCVPPEQSQIVDKTHWQSVKESESESENVPEH